MKRLLLPIVIALVGLGGGVGAAIMLRPDPVDEAAAEGLMCSCTDLEHLALMEKEADEMAMKEEMAEKEAMDEEEGYDDSSEYVELGEQFVVPVVEEGSVIALVVMTLSVEIAPGFANEVNAHRPKLRDLFLRELLDHANLGGFRGSFTSNGTLDRLRRALRERGQRAMGEDLRDILILDINRQEMI